MTGLVQLDDASLLSSLHAIVRTNREATSKIVAHLAEVEARRLHTVRGHSSLFVYCLKELHFSEDEACRRIDAARLARRFPEVLEMLEAGTVSLSVLGWLKHRIAPENADELLAGVAHKSVRDAKEWLAAKFPQPDLPDSVRKLPSNGRCSPAVVGSVAREALSSLARPNDTPTAERSQEGTLEAEQSIAISSETELPRIRMIESPKPARVEPLSADRFAVKLSIGRSVRDKLELARDLASHRLPTGRLEELFELCLARAVAKLRDCWGIPCVEPL
jgi:hypothetical protein